MAAPPAADGLTFEQLDLDPRILKALREDLGFLACTPIQAKTLPPALSGADVAGRAPTGSGKTAAFVVTILHHFLKQDRAAQPGKRQPFALVLAPTRELAIQIDQDARVISTHCPLSHVAVYGGLDYEAQRQRLAAGVDLLTATPGRLLDYLRRGAVDLSQVRILVLDEADRMLDMGFIPDVRRIVGRLPPVERRQTLLFSATLGPEVMRLASQWMRDPLVVDVSPVNVVPAEVRQECYAVAASEKLALLLSLLQRPDSERVLVFRNRRDQAERLTRELIAHAVDCELLSGDVPQKQRLRVLEAFRRGDLRVLVATDVAGRGIHVESISLVVNYDLPYEPQDYVHRIGRTGRAGVVGRAVSFACEEGSFILPAIESFIGCPVQMLHPEPQMLKLPHPVRPPPDKPDRPEHRSRPVQDRRLRGRSARPPRRGHGRR